MIAGTANLASWVSPHTAQRGPSGASTVDDGGQHGGPLVADRRLELGHPGERLDEEVDGAAAREADRERVVVAVAEGDEPPVAGGEHVERLGDHRPFDTAARHRAD